MLMKAHKNFVGLVEHFSGERKLNSGIYILINLHLQTHSDLKEFYVHDNPRHDTESQQGNISVENDLKPLKNSEPNVPLLSNFAGFLDAYEQKKVRRYS